MKTNLKLVVILLSAWSGAHAQVVPEATGPGKLPVGGNLQYALRYSQSAEFGGALGTWQTGTPSASVDYLTGNAHHPFTADYAGGYTAHISGPTYGVGFFQHLMISQGLVGHRWNIKGSDDVSYTPQSPVIGFAGVPGTGGPIGGPPSSSGQSILTLNTHSVSNIANGDFGHQLDFASNLDLGGSSSLLRYPDSNGLATNGLKAHAAFIRRLDARNSLSGQYVFSRYSYPVTSFSLTSGAPFSLDSNSVAVAYQRTWNREFKTNFSIGPQWISSSSSSRVPPTQGIAASAGVDYIFRSNSANVDYSHGTDGGEGYLLGATFDFVDGSFMRRFGRNLTVEATGTYRRTAGLQSGSGVTNARIGAAQVTRQLGRFVNVFANYTAVDQTSTLTSQTNVLNQLYQLISFGIAYSPRQIHLNQ
jgi:hypothetical protein